MTLRDYLRSKSLVGTAAIKTYLGCSSAYASLVLNRFVKQGFLKIVTRNKYSASDDMHAIATNMYTPSYLSFWSASQYYGYTEQILSTLHIATTTPHNDLHFEKYTFKFIPLPKKYFFGYTKVQTAGGALFVAEPEKLLLDALLRPREMGNFDEIVNIVQRAEITKERIISLLKTAKNSSLTKRVGYLLDVHKRIDISNDVSYKDANYVFLNPFNKTAKRTIAKWRVKL